MAANRIRVVVADDHEESLRVLARILQPEFEIIGTARNRDEAMAAVRELQPDVVVLCIHLLLSDGLDTARRLLSKLPPVQSIVLGAYPDADYEETARSMGAAGFVLKSQASLELPNAIRNAMIGRAL